MSPDIAARIDTWLQHCPAPENDPLPGMAEAGLLEPAESYAAIARTKAALVERTGLPGAATRLGVALKKSSGRSAE